MIDDQIDRTNGVDLLRIATQTSDSVTHSSEVDNGRNTFEIIKFPAKIKTPFEKG